MPALPAYVVAHADDDQFIRPFLVEIEFDAGTVRWTDHMLDVYALGERWLPEPIAARGFSSRQNETAVNAELEVGDADGLASAYITGATTPSGARGRVYEAWLPNTGTDTNAVATVKLCEFRIGRAETATRQRTMAALISLASAVELRFKRIGRRRNAAKCTDTFQDAACGSDGPDTSCDKTFTACSQPTKKAGNPIGGNRARFGGYRNLPKDGYVIEWGDGSFTVRTPERNRAPLVV